MSALEADESAWNPGLNSDIPRKLLPLVTLFREEHARVSYGEARELADLTGLSVLDVVALRPERLVVHELLVRVTADLSVSDGPDYAELGINLRGMVARVHDNHVLPQMAGVIEAYDKIRADAHRYIADQLDRHIHGSTTTPRSNDDPAARPDSRAVGIEKPDSRAQALAKKPWWRRLFGALSTDESETGTLASVGSSVAGRAAMGARSRSDDLPELVALERWRTESLQTSEGLHRSCLDALVKVVGAIVGHRGRLVGDRELLVRLAVNRVGNDHGARAIGAAIEPLFHSAVELEGYRYLPAQDKPVIMNVKGASASGKSTIRPQQRALAAKLAIPWEDFALISPDYWRKYLLDYASLGEHYKYGAMLTGQELEIVDRKLDRYMADKAAAGHMSHLLIDRFRFDSFKLEHDRTADSRLLTRFGDRIYLFFMITPPAETVERAWLRGLSTGRFKAVDDLLFHNVEAFTGMPALFLSWINAPGKRVHVEFLDNDVPKGALPRTAAIGWNGSLTILDVNRMLDIDRFRKVNVEACNPEEIFEPETLSLEHNLEFLRTCIDSIDEVQFADQCTGQVYALIVKGNFHWWDKDWIDRPETDTVVSNVLAALGYTGLACESASTLPALDLVHERQLTVGCWA